MLAILLGHFYKQKDYLEAFACLILFKKILHYDNSIIILLFKLIVKIYVVNRNKNQLQTDI